MKKFLISTGSLLITLECALWCGLWVYCLFLIPCELIFKLSAQQESLLRTLLGILGTTGGGIAWSYIKGYQKKVFNLKEMILSMLIIFAIQHFLALLLGYKPYISGTAGELADAVYRGMTGKTGTYQGGQVPREIKHICLLFLELVFYAPAIILGEYFGVRERKKQLKKYGSGTM